MKQLNCDGWLFCLYIHVIVHLIAMISRAFPKVFLTCAVLTAVAVPVDALPSSASHLSQSETLLPGMHMHSPTDVAELTFSLPKSGSTKSFNGALIVKNNSSVSVKLRLVKLIGFGNSSLPKVIQLSPGQSKKISFRASINSFQGFGALGVIYSGSVGGQAVAMQPIEMKDGKFRLVSTGDFAAEAQNIDVPSNVRILPGPRGYSLSMKGGKKLGKTSPEMKGALKSVQPSGSNSNPAVNPRGIENTPQRLINWLLTPQQLISSFNNSLSSALNLFVPPAHAVDGTYRGRFVFRSLHDPTVTLPASGIKVKAIRDNQKCNTSRPLARTFADGNGNFSLRIDTSGQYRICYVLANPFIKVGRGLGSTGRYRWADSLRSDIPRGRVTRRPIRHDGAMDIWHEAAFLQTSMTNSGVDPVRTGSNKIRVKFPSAVGDCSGSTNQPWSCAGTDGKLFIRDSHALRRGTMAHELAHQVDFKYRGWTTNSGGDHRFWSCYNPDSRNGMIVTEGWAAYETARALGSRAASEYTNAYRSDIAGNFIDNINLELNGPNCSSSSGSGLNGSESVVATTLWDFYDTRADGADRLHYTSPSRLTWLYLGRKPRTAEKYFEEIQSDCTANGNTAQCDNIFAQNGGSD